MPLVSIILPTRGRAVLPRAAASVLAQTERDFELLLVDNASGGRNFSALAADRRVRLFAAPAATNAGAVRNVGLAAATGEWITFLDDDDAYHPEKVERQLALARASAAPLVLCGACFRLRGRARVRHTAVAALEGDALLNVAGFGTPFLFHRRNDRVRFDESLSAGEDFHYAHALLAHFNQRIVPVATEPLVDVYQEPAAADRTNLRAEAGWRAARRVWWEFGPRFSRAARRLYVVRARIARAKLHGQTARVIALLPALFRAGGKAELRFAANAFLVSRGWGRGRWVT